MHDLGQTIAALVPLAFMLHWGIDVWNNVTNQDWKAVSKQASGYVLAFALLALYAHSTFNLGGTNANISDLPWQGLALAAWAVAAGGGAFADYLRARNNADPNVKPQLFGSRPPK